MIWMEEIQQQGEALRRYVGSELHARSAAEEALRAMVQERTFDRVLFTGMGSSLYACYVSAEILRRSGIFCECLESLEMEQSAFGLLDERTLVVAVSQSGESPETIELLRAIPERITKLAVTNYPASTLYRQGSISLQIHAGTEYMSSTKSFTNTLAAMVHLSCILVRAREERMERLAQGLMEAADAVDALVGDTETAARAGRFLADAVGTACVGGSYCYAAASHLELILEEVGKKYSSRYTPSQFIHGPIELIREGFCMIALEFGDANTLAKIRDAERATLEYGGKVLRITDGDVGEDTQRECTWRVRRLQAELTPIVAVVPVVMAVNAFSVASGGRPGVLTRVVKRMAL